MTATVKRSITAFTDACPNLRHFDKDQFMFPCSDSNIDTAELKKLESKHANRSKLFPNSTNLNQALSFAQRPVLHICHILIIMGDRKRGRKDLGPPPRWLYCPRKGALIVDKFIAFKTPLDDSYNSQVPEECTFTPAMLVSLLQSQKVRLGLWIDLTNTTRFYSKEEIEERNIKYVKLQCRGHGECPSEEQTNTFIAICQKFISKSPLEVIGVHCTHGFNRTGFLIVAYLIESLSWSVEAAVTYFSQARPPGIYKADYLKELFRRYGDVNDAFPAPPLPEWCNEDDDVDDDGKFVNEGKGGKDRPPAKKRKEFHRKNPVFMEGVPGVSTISELAHISRIQRKCQDMCGWKGSGFPGSQPVSMDINNLKFLHSKPYKVSWKADGTRYMMLIDGENEIYFIDRDNSIFKVDGLRFPRRKEPEEHLANTLLDGEMIIDKVDGKDVPRYLAYDIVKFESQDVGQTDFERRLLCIAKEIIKPRRDAMMNGKIDRMKEPFSVRAKDFWDVTSAKQILGEKFRREMSHEVDGLIFQPVPDPYVTGRCPDVLKWKPPELNSVDFKLVIQQRTGIGLLPTKVGLLYVGGMSEPFAEIKINKALRAMDKKIIECKYENNQWVFMRERTDKSFPNAYKTAMGVCESIRNPVTTDLLFHHIDCYRWRPPKK
ncbi:mRNA-capping enzyme [Trichonephila inaurata madagascariensis]|uniref:mRNA-capping enzyme n=1 Tax=Trichonephila inaurata madagascariensis TaxID=2747483 RepID=A0A8X6XRK4_9ARAC|nr:mRNA-capping enzyme [Trichonephila inaurata madagascariensis]